MGRRGWRLKVVGPFLGCEVYVAMQAGALYGVRSLTSFAAGLMSVMRPTVVPA